jgi:hypothetical protein
MITLELTEDEIDNLQFALTRANDVWFDKLKTAEGAEHRTFIQLIETNHELWDKLHAALNLAPAHTGAG